MIRTTASSIGWKRRERERERQKRLTEVRDSSGSRDSHVGDCEEPSVPVLMKREGRKRPDQSGSERRNLVGDAF